MERRRMQSPNGVARFFPNLKKQSRPIGAIDGCVSLTQPSSGWAVESRPFGTPESPELYTDSSPRSSDAPIAHGRNDPSQLSRSQPRAVLLGVVVAIRSGLDTGDPIAVGLVPRDRVPQTVIEQNLRRPSQFAPGFRVRRDLKSCPCGRSHKSPLLISAVG